MNAHLKCNGMVNDRHDLSVLPKHQLLHIVYRFGQDLGNAMVDYKCSTFDTSSNGMFQEFCRSFPDSVQIIEGSIHCRLIVRVPLNPLRRRYAVTNLSISKTNPAMQEPKSLILSRCFDLQCTLQDLILILVLEHPSTSSPRSLL